LRSFCDSIRDSPDEDTGTFVIALGLNWLLAATDGHAKNYSLLVAPGGRVRLAPLYDIASVLPYPQFDLARVKLTMKVGDKYRLRDIGRREWEKLSRDVSVNTDEVIGRLVQVAAALPDLIADAARSAIAAGLEHAAIQLLNTRLTDRARICLSKLVGGMR